MNDSVGAGYIDRNWPPALQESGAWPLKSLGQSFLNGALTRIIDPDGVLRNKIVEFVSRGEFGLASGQEPNGRYERVWYEELLPPEEVAFETGVFLLKKAKAIALRAEPTGVQGKGVIPEGASREQTQETLPIAPAEVRAKEETASQTCTLRLVGIVPPELWNRLGTKLIPKLRSGDLRARVEFTICVQSSKATMFEVELRQILNDLGLSHNLLIERTDP